MAKLNVAKEAFDVFMNIRETIAFYMFIIEEAIQTANMAAYIAQKYGNISECKETAEWVEENLINPLLDIADSPVGIIAYPMNEAYKAFAEASKKATQVYKSLEEQE